MEAVSFYAILDTLHSFWYLKTEINLNDLTKPCWLSWPGNHGRLSWQETAWKIGIILLVTGRLLSWQNYLFNSKHLIWSASNFFWLVIKWKKFAWIMLFIIILVTSGSIVISGWKTYVGVYCSLFFSKKINWKENPLINQFWPNTIFFCS